MKPYIYIYSRVSSDKQKHSASLDAQRDKIESKLPELTEETGLTEYSKYLVDSGVSAYKGDNVLEGSDLGDFIKKVESGQVAKGSILAVFSLDRLSRLDVMKSVNILTSLINNGIGIYSANTNRLIDNKLGASATVELILSVVELATANRESEIKSIRTRSSALYNIKRFMDGKRDSEGNPYAIAAIGKIPFWMKYQGEGKAKVVVKNEYYFDVAKKITEKFLEGYSVSALQRWLTEQEYKPPKQTKSSVKGLHPWALKTLQDWHKHSSLTGDRVINLRIQKDELEGIEVREDENGNVIPTTFTLKGYYPEVCTKADLDKLRLIRSKNHKNTSTSKKGVGLLSGIGILKCFHCGSGMSHNVVNKDNFNKNRYLCSAQSSKRVNHSYNGVNARKLDEIVLKVCMSRLWNNLKTTSPRDFDLEEQVLNEKESKINQMNQVAVDSLNMDLALKLGEQLKQLKEQRDKLSEDRLKDGTKDYSIISRDFSGITTDVLKFGDTEERLRTRNTLKQLINTVYVENLGGRQGRFNCDIRFIDGSIVDITNEPTHISITRDKLDDELDKEFLNRWGSDKPWIDELFDDELGQIEE